MNNFQALHTVDESGARCAAAEGWLLGDFATIEAAERALEGFEGGYIRRSDGAVQAPDGSWIVRAE